MTAAVVNCLTSSLKPTLCALSMNTDVNQECIINYHLHPC